MFIVYDVNITVEALNNVHYNCFMMIASIDMILSVVVSNSKASLCD